MEIVKATSQHLQNYTKSTKDISILKAIDNIKIKNIAGLKQIGDTLFVLYSLTGLNKNNYPNKEETILMANFIHENYKQYTLEEVQLSFKLAMTRDTLPYMGKNAEVGHYQSFSIEYFCKIMTAYRKYKEYHLKPLLAKQSKLKETEEISDYDFLKINFVNKFKVYLDGGYPWNYGVDITIFDLLIKNKVIELTDKEKSDAGNIVRSQLKSSYKDDKERKLDWIRLSKKHFFMEFLNNCRKNNTDLNELIKEI